MLHPLLDTWYTRAFFRDHLFFGISSAALFAHAAVWLLLFLGFDTIYTSDREYITLHYKILFGTDFVAQWFVIFLVPLVGLFVLIVNFILERTLYHIERRLAYALAAAALAVNSILIFALYLLLQVNL
ncbi:hypothetical protein HY732_04920 [Candidatus Uhrbacteria bacterium]|nr:hypothetical protein [Candidatus Uhrbacteria bacterium]